jgi:hypothetical protein
MEIEKKTLFFSTSFSDKGWKLLEMPKEVLQEWKENKPLYLF